MGECIHEHRLLAVEARLGKGDVSIATMSQTIDSVHTVVEKINKRLFFDNGTKCMQTKVDRMETIIRILIWFASAATLMMFGVLGRLIYLWVTT
jgi:hypothetical protein